MVELLAVFVALWLYVSAYLVSLYALAVYLDPDEVRLLIPRTPRRYHRLLTRLAGDPRALVQIATIYRALALVVITVCSVVFVGRVFQQPIASYVYPISLIAVWLLFIFFAEYLPRHSLRRSSYPVIPRYLGLIAVLYLLFYPLVAVYQKALARLGPRPRVTEKEKEDIVERAIETLAEQAGIGETIVAEDEKEMIGQIFLLDQTVVREIMSPRIDLVAIDKTSRFADIQDLVRREGYSRYPVYEGSIDRVIGILYVKDLFSNMPGVGEEFVISDYLREPYFVPETKVIGELLREFRDRKLHVAIVVDAYGGVSGLVTLEDILEEIVGEIEDEHDISKVEYRRLPDGQLLVDAGMRVERLAEILDQDLQADEHETIGGLVYHLVGSVPDEGTSVTWKSVRLEVVKVDGQRIKAVKVACHAGG